MSLMHPPPVWRRAMDAQVDSLELVKQLLRSDHPRIADLRPTWKRDELLLRNGSPFGWSSEPIEAVKALAEKIPADAQLNRWNLDSDAAFWWFEDPLPYQTLTNDIATDGATRGVRALSFGWLLEKNERRFFVVAWCDAPAGLGTHRQLTPSQVFEWHEGATLEQMLRDIRMSHNHLYGPLGPYYKRPKVGVNLFVDAAEKIARFLLGALLWLDSKILVEHEERPLRPERRRMERVLGREAPIKIINLRRVDYDDAHVATTVDGKRTYTCRWLVDGHARNQACGPNHSQRKLIWVHPYVKGPDDAPLRVPSGRVYKVER